MAATNETPKSRKHITLQIYKTALLSIDLFKKTKKKKTFKYLIENQAFDW